MSSIDQSTATYLPSFFGIPVYIHHRQGPHRAMYERTCGDWSALIDHYCLTGLSLEVIQGEMTNGLLND